MAFRAKAGQSSEFPSAAFRSLKLTHFEGRLGLDFKTGLFLTLMENFSHQACGLLESLPAIIGRADHGHPEVAANVFFHPVELEKKHFFKKLFSESPNTAFSRSTGV